MSKQSFAKCSAANQQNFKNTNLILQIILYNSQVLCIDWKSVYFKNLAGRGCFLKMNSYFLESNELIMKPNLRDLNATP